MTMALELRDIVASYGPVRVLKGLSLDVEQGEIIAILGGNGAGKSTVLKAICGLNHASSGTITLFGARIEKEKPHKIAAHDVALCAQGRQIFPKMTVAENLQMGAYARRDPAAIRTDLDSVFTLFPKLAERRRQVAGSLSGGEQQILAIARAMLKRPKLIMLDEPSLGVSPAVIDQIRQVIERLRGEGMTFILVEQNVDFALTVADRGYVLEAGVVAVEGTSEFLAGTDRVRAAYLGG